MAEAGSRTWTAGEPAKPDLHRLANSLGEVEALDAVAEPLSDAVRKAVPAGPVKDALAGTWLGHAVHPLLTDVTIAAWTSSLILDVIGGADARGASDRLLAVGIASAGPTAASGLVDWADTTALSDEVRRIGTVHAAANVCALLLYSASYAARKRGRRGRGVLLGLAGAGVLSVGGHLGGHLAYEKGVGVDQTVFEGGPTDWAAAGSEDDLQEGTPRKVEVEGAPVLLVRLGDRISAISSTCSHRGGPLEEGELEDRCIRCPLHGSVFRLEDGSVVRGPASAPQPAYDVRVREGRVEVRLRTPASRA
jgi:nitrite reductase/ring-hydroxylating ferredoxin subunit/uncharacterized membrane protein